MSLLASQSKAIVFHVQIASEWSSFYDRRSFKKRFKAFRSIISAVAPNRPKWLDLGCGSGVLTAELLCLGCEVDAVDGSQRMIDSARLYVSDEGGLATFHVCDAHNLSWALPMAYDGVLCSSVIEYLDRPSFILAEINRVMRPGGALVISIPSSKSLIRNTQKRIRALLAYAGVTVFEYLRHSQFEIDQMLAPKWFHSFGFEVVQAVPFDPLIPRRLFSFFSPTLVIYELRKYS